MNIVGVNIIVGGTVQGVGFRPFVFRTAQRFSISGTVCNSIEGVVIHAQGEKENIKKFISELRNNPPPLAYITSFRIKKTKPDIFLNSFTIVESQLGDSLVVDVTRDSATCEKCLSEMRNPNNRRFNHPFINCTDCGPRFTIIESLPFDRSHTTMRSFSMCKNCAEEYADSKNRRFHAQALCCNECGPKLQLLDSLGNTVECDDPLSKTISMLKDGQIVAIKGLGGFHLACRADIEETVVRLRLRKRREQKPFAIMVGTIEAAAEIAEITSNEMKLLNSIERPIVIMNKKSNMHGIAPSVAPKLTTIGIMLAYTPIQHLLFDRGGFKALVMTSANISNEPICSQNDEAIKRLAGIADAFLVHDRSIYVRIDDSVVRDGGGITILVRRARGYVPSPLFVRHNVTGVIGLGGIMKSTVSVGRGRYCYVSQYLGSADTVETIENISNILAHFLSILGVEPFLYVGDLHPTASATNSIVKKDVPLIKVQHHHAHAAACLAENGIEDKAVCVIYDGLGMGDDSNIWGGEIFVADTQDYKRAGHLVYMPMPGADAATRNPGRMAIAALYGLIGEKSRQACEWMSDLEKDAIISMLAENVNCIKTSSMGRLFDSCSALLGICIRQSYEGQPAIELEAIADSSVKQSYELAVECNGDMVLMDGRKVLLSSWQDYLSGRQASAVAAKFHNTIADMTVEAAALVAKSSGIDYVCLCGGCFQNRLLLQRTVSGLRCRGLQPIYHRILPPSDEAISFGQVVIGAKKEKV